MLFFRLCNEISIILNEYNLKARCSVEMILGVYIFCVGEDLASWKLREVVCVIKTVSCYFFQDMV